MFHVLCEVLFTAITLLFQDKNTFLFPVLTDMSAASVDLMDLQVNEGILEEEIKSHAPEQTTASFPLPSRITHHEGTSSDPDLLGSIAAVNADKKTIAGISPESSISQEELDEGEEEEEEQEDDDLLEAIPESPKSVEAPETKISSGRTPAFDRISEEERGLSSDSASSKGLKDDSTSMSKPSSASSNEQRSHSPLARLAGKRPSLHRMTAVEETKSKTEKTVAAEEEAVTKEPEEIEKEEETILPKDSSIPQEPLVDPRFEDVEEQEKARVQEGMQTILKTFAKEAVLISQEPSSQKEVKVEAKAEVIKSPPTKHEKVSKPHKQTMWSLGQISPSKVKPLLPMKPNPERLLPIGPSPRDVISPKPVCFKSYTITKESRKSPGPAKPTDLPVPSIERLLPIGPTRDRSKSPHSGSIKRLSSPEPTYIQMPLQSSSPIPPSVFFEPLPTNPPPPKPPRLHPTERYDHQQESRHKPKLSEVVIPIDSEPEIMSLSIMMEKSLESAPEETSLPPITKVTAKILEKVTRSSPGSSVPATPVTEGVVTVVTSSAASTAVSSVTVTVTTTSIVPIVVAKTATVVTQASSQAVTVTLPSSSGKEASISFPASSMREAQEQVKAGMKAQVVLASSPQDSSLDDKVRVSSTTNVVLSSKKDKKKKGKKKSSQQLEKKESSSSSSSKEKTTTSTGPAMKKDLQESSSPTSSVKEKKEKGKTTVSSSGSSPAKSSSSFAKKRMESKSETQTPTESVKESVRKLREGMTTSSSLGMISAEINQTLESTETVSGGNIINKTPKMKTAMASYAKNGQVSSSTSAVDESGRPGGGRQYKQRRQRKTGGMNFMESQRSLDNKTTCGTTGGVAAGVQRRARKTESSASAASKRSSISQVSLPGDRETTGNARVGDTNVAGGATCSMSYYHDDGSIHERCPKCNHVMEEFSEEEIGMCIIILRTYVHRESALAAPILPEMLKLVSRFASYFPYAWQTER